MLVITKLTLEDEPDNYKQDIRDHCAEIINNDQQELCDENRTIISSLISNDIYIMEKASKIKQQYTEQERQDLWNMIKNLQSSAIELKVYITNQINQEFTKYFNQEMHKKKQRVNQIISSFSQISTQMVEKKNKDDLLKMYELVSQVKTNVLQLECNQIQKVEAIENLYFQISQLTNNQDLAKIEEINNFSKIYNRFYPLKEQIFAYSLEFFNNEDLNSLTLIEKNLEKELQLLDMINSQQIAQKEREIERLKQQNQQKQQELMEIQAEKKRQYNDMRRHIENQKRGWWFWMKNKIPDWVEDVDEYIRLGG